MTSALAIGIYYCRPWKFIGANWAERRGYWSPMQVIIRTPMKKVHRLWV
jgi:hypothetical protein